MKIIEVISDTNIGGAGVLLVNRLKHTDTEKYQTIVVLPQGSMLRERFQDIGIKCICMDCKGDCSFDAFAVKKYARLFKRERPDIVNCHGSLSARIAAKICRVPVKICTRHCVFPVKKRDRMCGFINNYLSDCFIAVAHSARENLISMGIDKRKIKVIINGSEQLRKISETEKKDIKMSLKIGDCTLVLSFCARLEECKGHKWFFKTVQILAKKGIDFKVILIGDGSQRKALEGLSHEYNIQDKVIFMGFVSDTAPLMNIADININCSVGTETSSLALSEGMSIGLPCVVSNYGGNSYMVKHGVNGFVCECGDSKCMAKYIILLMQNRELHKKMSANARKRFETELNSVAMTRKTNCLYDTLYQKHISYRQKSKS